MAYDLAAIRKAKQTYKAPGVTMGIAAGLTMPTQAPKPVSTLPRTESTLNNIQSSVNKPFEFNADSDQGYQSALRAAQQNLQVSQKNTNAQLRASGQGKSSYSETVANQLANQSNENIANNILPQYVQQAYGRYQDNISNQSNLYGLQYQQDVTTPQNEAALTGNYVPPAAKTAIDGILSLKQQAEAKGITAAQRGELSKQADGLRAQLQSLGIDPSKYGANVNASQAGAINPGIRTLAGQSQDQSVKNDNLNAAATVAGLTGKVVTPQTDYQGLIRQAANPNAPSTAAQGNFDRQQTFNEGQQAFSNQFDKVKFDEDTRRYGLDYALSALSQSDQAAYQQAQLSLSEDDNSRAWAELDWKQSQPTESAAGLTANQILDSMKGLYTEDIMSAADPRFPDQKTKTGTRITADPAKRKEMFQQVVDAGKSDAETDQILNSLGMTKAEIEKFTKEYSGNG